MKVEMTQLYLCEEPYWSKYDQSDLYEHPIEINVISDGEQNSTLCFSFKNLNFDALLLSNWESLIAFQNSILLNIYLGFSVAE